MSLKRRRLTGVTIVLWRALHNNGGVPMIISHSLLRNQRHGATIVPTRMSKWKFQWYKPGTVAFTQCRLRDEPKGRCWSGMAPESRYEVSVLQPFWIFIIICCWNVKLLKLPSVTLTNVCGTNSHNWWAKGLPEDGAVKNFCDSDSSDWKSFRLHTPAHHCVKVWSLCSTLVLIYTIFVGIREKEPGSSTLLYRSVKFVLMTSLTIHFTACLWYNIACGRYDDAGFSISLCSSHSWIFYLPEGKLVI